MFALFKHAKNFVSHDERRPMFNGIYFDGNRAIASNTSLLVIVENVLADKQVIHWKTGKPIKGNYPDINRVIPAETKINFELLNIRELINALKISMLVSRKSEYNVCCLKTGENGLILHTSSPATDSVTAIESDLTEKIEIYINAKYLHDILVFFNEMEVERVYCGMNSPLTPIKLTTDKNVLAILSPIRCHGSARIRGEIA